MESKRTRALQPWLVVAALLIMLGFGAANVAAQDEGSPVSLPSTSLQASPEASDDAVSVLPETGLVIQASPEAEPADDSVSALPETGSGSDSTSTGVLVAALALATSVLGLGALATRKMLLRR
jgi:hypothetical protein